MFNAKLFAKEEKYREEHWAGLNQGLGGGGPNDRPLVAQVQLTEFQPSFILSAVILPRSNHLHTWIHHAF